MTWVDALPQYDKNQWRERFCHSQYIYLYYYTGGSCAARAAGRGGRSSVERPRERSPTPRAPLPARQRHRAHRRSGARSRGGSGLRPSRGTRAAPPGAAPGPAVRRDEPHGNRAPGHTSQRTLTDRLQCVPGEPFW